jgi:hypothetical protein
MLQMQVLCSTVGAASEDKVQVCNKVGERDGALAPDIFPLALVVSLPLCLKVLPHG